jgi:putative SOS response-associated peptidase YedK
MCGRYEFFPGEFTDLRIRFNLPTDLPLFKPSFNIAPGKDVPVIVGDVIVTLSPNAMGLVPSWSRDPTVGNQMINARCEMLDQRPQLQAAAPAQPLLNESEQDYSQAT